MGTKIAYGCHGNTIKKTGKNQKSIFDLKANFYANFESKSENIDLSPIAWFVCEPDRLLNVI